MWFHALETTGLAVFTTLVTLPVSAPSSSVASGTPNASVPVSSVSIPVVSSSSVAPVSSANVTSLLAESVTSSAASVSTPAAVPVPAPTTVSTSTPVPVSASTSIPLPSVAAVAVAPASPPLVIINNHCPFPIFASSTGLHGPSPVATIPATTGSWNETQYFSGIGTAIKVTRDEGGIFNGAPVLILAYTYAPDRIYYDLGAHAGWGFDNYAARLSGKGGDNLWNGGVQKQDTRSWVGETELVLETCAQV